MSLRARSTTITTSFAASKLALVIATALAWHSFCQVVRSKKRASQEARSAEGIVADLRRVGLRVAHDHVVDEVDVDDLGSLPKLASHLDVSGAGRRVSARVLPTCRAPTSRSTRRANRIPCIWKPMRSSSLTRCSDAFTGSHPSAPSRATTCWVETKV